MPLEAALQLQRLIKPNLEPMTKLKLTTGTLGWLLWLHQMPAIASPQAVTAEAVPSPSPQEAVSTITASDQNPKGLEILADTQLETTSPAASLPAASANQTSVPLVPILPSPELPARQPLNEIDAQLSTRAADLSPQPLSTSTSWSELPAFKAASAPPEETETSRSPLERPVTRLFGFETATPLNQGELMFNVGGISFNTPNDVRGNRSNDIRFGLDYGITDRLQLSVGALGKDDTIFSNLVNNNTQLTFIYGGIASQLKWQVYKSRRLNTALVVGAEFPFQTVPARFTPNFNQDYGPRQIYFGIPDFSAGNALLAEDNSVYFSIAAPISYQLNKQARLHLNPQISFFPNRISVIETSGDPTPLQAANIGFDGEQLNYFGTIAGLGLGFDYSFTPRIQFAADFTPIVAGQNSADSGGNDSFFVGRPVWNAGIRVAPNSRVGVNLYATNRFGPITAAPSNLLVQPGGDWGVGLDFIYLPDLGSDYEIDIRKTYPEASAFLSQLNGIASTTLPMNSVVYQLAYGSIDRINPTVRLGLLDDFELMLNYNQGSTNQIPSEGSIIGRLAVLPDKGQEGLSTTISAGLLAFEGSDTATAFSLYADLPFTYRYSAAKTDFTITPKFLLPAQALGISNIFAITLGAKFSVTRNTQLIAQFTPILLGENQLQDSPVANQFVGLEGRTSLYNVGIRQLFPAGNSLYALDLYLGNSVADYGLQGVSAIADNGTQVGVRFSILNGIPATSQR